MKARYRTLIMYEGIITREKESRLMRKRYLA